MKRPRLDAALNAGGPSVYLMDGLNRYRLFFNKSFQVEPGHEYTAEGIYAQKAIDAIGDPAKGKNGYPLETSCARVVRMAWPGLAFDVTDSYANSLRAKVNRFPARPVFLVTKIEPDTIEREEREERRKCQTSPFRRTNNAPFWSRVPRFYPRLFGNPEGGTAHCKVVIDEEGKIAELDSGAQLCETVPWAQFHYKPTIKGGHPVRVNTEVEVPFDPRK